jgi:hypothetical protein
MWYNKIQDVSTQHAIFNTNGKYIMIYQSSNKLQCSPFHHEYIESGVEYLFTANLHANYPTILKLNSSSLDYLNKTMKRLKYLYHIKNMKIIHEIVPTKTTMCIYRMGHKNFYSKNIPFSIVLSETL